MGYPVDKSKGSEFKKKKDQDYEGTRRSIIEQYKSKSVDEIDRMEKAERTKKNRDRSKSQMGGFYRN